MPLDLRWCHRQKLLRLVLNALAISLSATWAPLSTSKPSEPLPLPAASTDALLATPLFTDPVLEAQVMKIAHELRCLVCQNETIAASHAELAQDLRKQIRLKLQQGQTPDEILDFMVARYGDFVRYRPALKGTTLFLWVGPFVLLSAALTVLVFIIRQRRNTPACPLSESQRARAQALLTSSPPPSSS